MMGMNLFYFFENVVLLCQRVCAINPYPWQ